MRRERSLDMRCLHRQRATHPRPIKLKVRELDKPPDAQRDRAGDRCVVELRRLTRAHCKPR